MKTIFFLLSLVLASGCGKTYQIDPDFGAIVDEFNTQAGDRKAQNLIIEYGQTANRNAGATCYQDFGKTPRIAVDKETWHQLSDASRREAIRHEMGHCVLEREHTHDRMAEDNCPVSIMNPTPVSELCRQNHGPEYEEELFR